MLSCWSTDPDDRPTFHDISKTLSGYTETLAGYLDMTYNPFTATTTTPGHHHHQQQQQKGLEGAGFNNNVLVRPDQLALLFDDEIPRPTPSPNSPRKYLSGPPMIQIDACT